MRKEDFGLNVKIAWHAIKQNKQQQKKTFIIIIIIII